VNFISLSPSTEVFIWLILAPPGEALEVATGGRLRATPHCVRVGIKATPTSVISRETFALFMAPDTHQRLSDLETYGSFSKRIIESHYAPDVGISVQRSFSLFAHSQEASLVQSSRAPRGFAEIG
jgi:isopenicillin N synthase-like dioxygenase